MIDRLSRPIVDVQRELRGRVYQASRLVRRLEAADVRNVEQQVALDQARELLDVLRRRAAVEGIDLVTSVAVSQSREIAD